MISSTIEKKMRSIKAIIYAVFIAGVLTGCTVKMMDLINVKVMV
jgi:hypothetical protein